MEKNLPSSEKLKVELRHLRNSVKNLELALQSCTQENAQLQEKLRQTSEITHLLDQQAIVSITDEQGIIRYANSKFCQLSQYTSQELTGQTHRIINSGFHPESFFAGLWQAIIKGKVWEGQIKNRAKDGSLYWVDTVITPLLDEEGKPYQFISIQKDITRQKAEKEITTRLPDELNIVRQGLQVNEEEIWQMQAHILKLNDKINENEEMFRAVANTQPVLLWMSDASGNCVYRNEVWLAFTGRTFEQEIGKGWEEDIHPDDLSYCLTVYREAFDKRATFTMEYRMKRYDGVYRWMLDAGGPRFKNDGTFFGYVSSLVDITQQKEAEERLKESEAKHRLITENMSDLIGMHDTTGKFIYITSSVKAILGYEPEDLLGKTPFDFTHPDDLLFIINEYNRIVQEKDSTYVQYKFRKKNGDYVWLETIAQTVTDEAEETVQVHSASRDITARKKVEESLRLFQFCIENSSDSVLWISPEAHMLYVNKAAGQLLGYKQEELLGMTVADIDPTYQPDRWPVYWQDLRKKGYMRLESMHKLRNGRIIPTEVSANYLQIGDKEYNFVFVRDISERRASEQNLRFNNYILSLVRDVIVGMDSNNIVVYWNKAAELQYGISAADAIGKPLSECYLEEWLNEEDEQKATQSIARSGYCHVENIHVLKTGERIYVESDVQQINFPDSGLIGLFAVIRDITGRKQAEADLLNYAQRSITILESITDSMLILNQNWQVVYLNKQAEVVLGMRREGVLHKNIWDIYDTVVGTTFYDQFNKAFQENTDIHFEEYFEPLNKWFEVHAYPSSEGLSVYFRSIHERKVAEENLKNTLEELKRRNYELDNYVYKVSHDLRAPLSSILGLIGLIKMEENPATIRHYISLIENRINKSDQFIHSVLNHSRILNSQVKVNKIDFRKIISESYEELKYVTHSEKLHIEINISGETPFYNDEFRLDIIFKNFISNAIKYMNPYADYSYLKFDIAVNEKEAMIQIQDNGIGIDKTYMEKVFDMFFRATEKSDGSGLGLYIVKQTLDRIGGTIDIASELGKGTTFTITLRNDLDKN